MIIYEPAIICKFVLILVQVKKNMRYQKLKFINDSDSLCMDQLKYKNFESLRYFKDGFGWDKIKIFLIDLFEKITRYDHNKKFLFIFDTAINY